MCSRALIPLALALLSLTASAAGQWTMDGYEDEDIVSDFTLDDTGLSGDVVADCEDQNVTVGIDLGRVRAVPAPDWSGKTTVVLTNGTSTEIVLLTIFPVNDAPVVDALIGPGLGMVGDNVVNASVRAHDPEGDAFSFTWLLDGEEIASGPNLTYCLFPGPRNLTLVMMDAPGDATVLTFLLEVDPPPGWDDRPDNDRNRAIFWAVFGLSGLLALGFIAWSLLGGGKANSDLSFLKKV